MKNQSQKNYSFKEMGKLLKESRIKKGWSQADLSALIGMKAGQGQYISNIERGISGLPPKHGLLVCSKLDIDRETMIAAMVEDFKNSLMRELSRGEQ